MNSKFLYISGFNGSRYVADEEKNILNVLKSNNIDIKQIDYYKYYKKTNSKSLIEGVVQDIIKEYYKDPNRRLNIAAWSLGGCILSESLNLITLLNEKINNENDKIKIGKILLFSPAWYILDFKNLVKSFFNPNDFYISKKVEDTNKKSEQAAIQYLLSNPNALYHLFNISKYTKNKTNFINETNRDSENGLDIFTKFDTTCIIPQNDKYINVRRLKEKVNKLGIKSYNIGDYGHMAPTIIELISDLYKKETNSNIEWEK